MPEGFEVVLAAGPPLVSFPMLGSFDERGRLFLAENAGVNLDEKTLDAQLPSRIRMLEDTDGDGVFDRSTVFADRFAFPQGALWHDGALYVTSAPAVWRVEDKDGDGRADSRVAIATGFKSTGNAADVHGPFLHPNGRLYWCHGRKGHEVYQNNGGPLVSKGLGARIWSCRPDGSDIRVHAGGGMDNPVEVAFNQEGDVFGTANIFQGTPRNDAVLHWVHGGVYPRTDQEPVLAEFRRTGDLLPAVALIGHVAPAGIALPRSGTLGDAYRDNVFFAEFNTRRIMRLPLAHSGSTYRGAAAQPFAIAADPGVHFTDVLEDADGSLLLVDTGAWFRRGCPTSVVSRTDILGAVYRVRRKGAATPEDPRGLAIGWDTASNAELVARLGETRVAVRDRAVASLARRGESAVPNLRAALGDPNRLVKSNAIWALTRIGTPDAQAAAREGLYDLDARIRQVACASAFATADRAAAELLVAKLGDDSQAVQREAAHALGRLRDARAVTALGGAAALPRDPMLTHAIVLALIEIDAPAETKKLLAHREPLARRAAMLALDGTSPAELPATAVFTALSDPHPALRAAALDIVKRRREWSASAARFLSAPPVGIAREVLGTLLTAFLPSDDVRAWIRTRLARTTPDRALDPHLLLLAIAGNPGAWDDAWREFLTGSLRSTDTALAGAALQAIAAHRGRDFSDALREVGRDSSRPAAFRVSALQIAAGDDSVINPESFNLLLEPFAKGGSAEERQQAASVLGAAKLDAEQLLKLVEMLPGANPVEMQSMLGAFLRGPSTAEMGARLLAQLEASPGRWGVRQTTLQQIFQRYPAPAYENAAPLIAEIMNQNVARESRLAELEAQADGGDVARGRAAFANGAGACVGCHRIGDTGAAVGPDLTHIGRIRSVRDLLEAIAFPNAGIARGYETFHVATKDGRTFLGRIPRETAEAVFVLGSDGREEPVPRNSITIFEPVAMSLMPPGLDRAMDARTLADLVAFLKSLQ